MCIRPGIIYTAGNGIDMWFEWAAITLHGKRGAAPSRKYASGSVQVRPQRDGRIMGYSHLEEVMAKIHPWMFDLRLPTPGTPTDPLYKGYLNNVWFRLRHPDYDTLRELMTYVGDRLKIHVG